MYVVLDKNKRKNKTISIKKELDIEGFPMASSKKVFMINGIGIKDITISSKKLAHPIVSRQVFKKYQKLVVLLTNLIVDDDEDGESCREALNQIEKFRLQIKNKYREFLKQKELETMSKQLVMLQKEATKKLMEIQNSYYEMLSTKKGK